MKKLLLVVFIAGCSTINDDKVQAFIPGAYVRFKESEYGKVYDTIVISVQNKSANHYLIVNRWRYERAWDGKMLQPEYKVETTSGIYDPKHKLLQQRETMDLFSFDVHEKLLFIGPMKYKKL